MSELRAAVIGVGYLGNFHAEKYQRIPGVRLVGVADTDSERAKQVARRYDVKDFQDYEALLPLVDVVSIVVPSDKHYKVAKDCLSAGVHCLVEKPLTELVSQADELIDLASAKRTVLQVGHLERFNPVARKVLGLIKSPEFFRARRFSQYQPRGTETNVVLDLMIHDLDIVLSLTSGRVCSILATGARVISEFVDIANARIGFSDGLVAELQASRVSSETVREAEIHADESIFKINYLTHEASVSKPSPGGTERRRIIPIFDKNVLKADVLFEEIAAFVSSVSSGSLPLVTGEDGKKALELAVEISRRIKISGRHTTRDLIES